MAESSQPGLKRPAPDSEVVPEGKRLQKEEKQHTLTRTTTIQKTIQESEGILGSHPPTTLTRSGDIGAKNEAGHAGLKRSNTMEKTLKEGQAFLGGSTTTGTRSGHSLEKPTGDEEDDPASEVSDLSDKDEKEEGEEVPKNEDSSKSSTAIKPALGGLFGQKASLFGKGPTLASNSPSTSIFASKQILLPGFGTSSFKGSGGGFGTIAQNSSNSDKKPAFSGTPAGFGSIGGGGGLFMKHASALPTKEQQESIAESKKPVFEKNVTISTGEEDEAKLCQTNAKVYCFVKGKAGESQWHERGVGILSLNESKKDSSHRLVMRQAQSKRLILNAPLWLGLAPERISDKTFRVSVRNFLPDEANSSSDIQIFLIKTSAKDSDLLFDLLADKMKDLPKQDAQAQKS